jgi:hypothetical protein
VIIFDYSKVRGLCGARNKYSKYDKKEQKERKKEQKKGEKENGPQDGPLL